MLSLSPPAPPSTAGPRRRVPAKRVAPAPPTYVSLCLSLNHVCVYIYIYIYIYVYITIVIIMPILYKCPPHRPPHMPDRQSGGARRQLRSHADYILLNTCFVHQYSLLCHCCLSYLMYVYIICSGAMRTMQCCTRVQRYTREHRSVAINAPTFGLWQRSATLNIVSLEASDSLYRPAQPTIPMKGISHMH